MRSIAFIFLTFVLFGAAAHGQDFPIPDVDPLAQLLLLIRDWKAMGPLALGMAITVFLVQVVKRFAPGFQYSRLAVTVLSVVYAVLLAVSSGRTWLESAIAVIVVGGGAIAIYEAFKGIKKALTGGT